MSRYYYHTKISHTQVNSNTWLPREAYNPRINFCDKEDVTYLSFDEWLVLYNADPEGWHILNDNDVEEKEIPYITCPAYCFPPDRKKFQIIKFRKRRDFRKWLRFIKKMKIDGQDFENLQEYQKLLQCAQKVASERVEKSKAEVEKQYDEMIRLIEKATRGTKLGE